MVVGLPLSLDGSVGPAAEAALAEVAILADVLGMHLDLFQRIVVDPCSVSAVRYTAGRPFVLMSNDTSGDLTRFVPAKPGRRRRRPAGSDATVGGGAGAGAV